MAQLGDTTVVGDLSATGKVWGEGNRVYIPDYNTFDPTKLNMQVGEMLTVYNDLTDQTKSHSPWNNSSAGYIIKTNSLSVAEAGCMFILVIYRSYTNGDFAIRPWYDKQWKDWVIGGRRFFRTS